MLIELNKEMLDRAVKICGGSDKKLGAKLDRTARQIRNYRKNGKAPKLVVEMVTKIAKRQEAPLSK